MLKINRAYSINLGQHSILPERAHFYEKRHFFEKSPPPPYSIPFKEVLYQNKTLHNFPKRGQHLIVKRNIGLEYALSTIRKILKVSLTANSTKPHKMFRTK